MKYLVTGANRGIGLQFAKTLSERGDHVFATARNPEEADELLALASDNVQVLALDIADPQSVKELSIRMKDEELDVLINNAGVYSRGGTPDRLDFDGIRKDFEVNTMGTLRVVQAALPALRAGRAKKIVNVTSKMGSIADNTSGGSYSYRMSKAALNMGTRSLAHDLAGEGFVVFVIHPGWVLTSMGGPSALIDTKKSVDGMLSVIDGADRRTSGLFWNWDGSQIEW